MILDRVRAVCLALPEVYEEQAWVGTRWRVRGRTFAHLPPGPEQGGDVRLATITTHRPAR